MNRLLLLGGLALLAGSLNLLLPAWRGGSSPRPIVRPSNGGHKAAHASSADAGAHAASQAEAAAAVSQREPLGQGPASQSERVGNITYMPSFGIFPRGCKWREVCESNGTAPDAAVVNTTIQYWDAASSVWSDEQPAACSLKALPAKPPEGWTFINGTPRTEVGRAYAAWPAWAARQMGGELLRRFGFAGDGAGMGRCRRLQLQRQPPPLFVDTRSYVPVPSTPAGPDQRIAVRL